MKYLLCVLLLGGCCSQARIIKHPLVELPSPAEEIDEPVADERPLPVRKTVTLRCNSCELNGEKPQSNHIDWNRLIYNYTREGTGGGGHHSPAYWKTGDMFKTGGGHGGHGGH